MTAFIVIIAASCVFVGLCPAIENDEGVTRASVGLAGCGASAILAVIVGGLLA